MVTLPSVQPELSPWRGWWCASSGDRNSCEERSLHYHTVLFCRYLHFLLCIWSHMLFLLRKVGSDPLYLTTPNTNALIVRLSCSERVKKGRERWMDGGGGKNCEREGACVCICASLWERERESALCSILWAFRHCAGWEKRQLNPQSRKRTNTRIKRRRFVWIVRASLKVLRDASACGRWAKWSGARQDSSRLERSCFLQPLTGGPCARGGELPPFLSLSLSLFSFSVLQR